MQVTGQKGVMADSPQSISGEEAATLDRLRTALEVLDDGLKTMCPLCVTRDEFALLIRSGSQRPFMRALLDEVSAWRLGNPLHAVDRGRLLALAASGWPYYFGEAYESLRGQFSEADLALLDDVAGESPTFSHLVLEVGVARLNKTPAEARRYVQFQRRKHHASSLGWLLAVPVLLVVSVLLERPKSALTVIVTAVVGWYILTS